MKGKCNSNTVSLPLETYLVEVLRNFIKLAETQHVKPTL